MLLEGEGVGMNSWPREGEGKRGGWYAANATPCHNGFRWCILHNQSEKMYPI